MRRSLNDRIAATCTRAVGSMWCVYAFSALTIVPLFEPRTLPFVQFISSAFLQLVLLPMLMVGQRVLGADAERRAKQDHETLRAEMRELLAIHTILVDRPCLAPAEGSPC